MRKLTILQNSSRIVFLWMVVVTILYVFWGAFNLSNFRPVSSDEVYIISVSHKLESQGILGSDLLHGFFNADQHFFINLPGQHIWQAIVFRIFGAGIAQARWVSLGFGILLLWAVTLLAHRWFGTPEAIISSLLVLFWRTNLTATPPGISFSAAARSARYDIGAVALSWLAIFWLDHLIRKPSPQRALITGLFAGFAALTHFTGFFIWPFILIALIWHFKKRLFKSTLPYWLALGGFTVVFPYLILALSNLFDLLGQYTFVYGRRSDFASLDFYLDNILREPNRFIPLLNNRTPGPWLLVIFLFPSLVYVWRRYKRRKDKGSFVLLASMVTFGACLALIDQTKAPIYSLILLPSICIVVAIFLSSLLRASWNNRYGIGLRSTVGALSIGILSMIFFEGGYVYWRDYQHALEVSAYDQVGSMIQSSLKPGEHVLGAERWWWTLREHRYTSLRNMYSQWLRDHESYGQRPKFAAQISANNIDVLLVNDNVRGDITHYSQEFQAQFWQFVEDCTISVHQWHDHTYGKLNLYRVRSTFCPF